MIEKLPNTITYDPSIPIVDRFTTYAKNLWLPEYPLFNNVNTLYTFYNQERVYYVGKTILGRQRYRWHLHNTLCSTEVYGWPLEPYPMFIEVTTLDLSSTNKPLIHYEAILIRQLMPVYNVNLKKVIKDRIPTNVIV